MNTPTLESTATLVGVLGGITLSVVALLVPEWRFLAAPGLAVLLPSLIYGLR